MKRRFAFFGDFPQDVSGKNYRSHNQGSSSPKKERDFFFFFLLSHSKMTIIANYFRHYASLRVFQTKSLGKCAIVRHKLQHYCSYGLVFDVSRTYHLFRTFFSVERSRKVSSNWSTYIGNFLPFSPDDVKRLRFWNALFEGQEDDVHTHSKQKTLCTDKRRPEQCGTSENTFFHFFYVTTKVVNNEWTCDLRNVRTTGTKSVY